MPRPLVTIVMATFNRSNVIGYAIESVRRQSLADWELLVVGDACTDDTADVVAAVGDRRIRFWNLETPTGEQAGPNNAGLAEARGRYVAMLNHDDLWAPGHLRRAVDALDAAPEIDLVYGLNVAVLPGGGYRVLGPTRSGRYESHCGVPASGWVFRRSLLAAVGPWRLAREIFDAPSQDWLRRAARAGARLELVPRLSVVSFPSGSRPRSYAERHEMEHKTWSRRMASDDFEAELLSDAVRSLTLTSYTSASTLSVRPFATRAIKNVIRWPFAAAGLSAHAIAFALRYRRRGGFVNHLRRVRGLGPLPRR
jgi:glycosyltransferase involved in cell wall biosynthesis